jgi:hypothetical protein
MSGHVYVATPLARLAAAASAMQDAAYALNRAYAEFLSASAEIRAAIPAMAARAGSAAYVSARIPHAGPVSDGERNTSEHQAVAARNAAVADAERHLSNIMTAGEVNLAERFGFELSSPLWSLLSKVPTHVKEHHSNAPPAGSFAQAIQAHAARFS